LLSLTLESSPLPSLLKGYNTYLQWRCSKTFSNPTYYTALEWRCSKPFFLTSLEIFLTSCLSWSIHGDALNRSHVTTTILVYSGDALNLSFSHPFLFLLNPRIVTFKSHPTPIPWSFHAFLEISIGIIILWSFVSSNLYWNNSFENKGVIASIHISCLHLKIYVKSFIYLYMKIYDWKTDCSSVLRLQEVTQSPLIFSLEHCNSIGYTGDNHS
jgi:hypothetical protein